MKMICIPFLMKYFEKWTQLREVHSRPYKEGIPVADVQYSMSSSRTTSWQALGAFFHAMQLEQVHWYSVIILKQTTASDEQLYMVFSSLSKILSIEEEKFHQVLDHCAVVMYKKSA